MYHPITYLHLDTIIYLTYPICVCSNRISGSQDIFIESFLSFVHPVILGSSVSLGICVVVHKYINERVNNTRLLSRMVLLICVVATCVSVSPQQGMKVDN